MKPHAQDKPKAPRKACQSKSDAVAARQRDDKRKRRAIYTAFRKRFGKAWKVQTIHGKGEVFVKVSADRVAAWMRVPIDTADPGFLADSLVIHALSARVASVSGRIGLLVEAA